MSLGLDSPRPAAPGVDPAAVTPTAVRSTGGRWLVVVIGVVVLFGLTVASLFLGSGDIPAATVWESLMGRGEGVKAVLVVDFRVPRTILAIAVGASLAVAGALMQALTRNPLADPGLLGVNAGAFFAVVLSVVIFGVADLTNYLWFSFAGAGLATVAVYLIGSAGRGATPVRLVLSGVALGAVLNGIAYSFTLMNPDIFDKIRFWQAGALQGRTWTSLWVLIPVAIGLVLAAAMARSLNALALGDDLAISLGVNLVVIRILTMIGLTLLCGAATAAVGPISFLGLMVPYLARVFASSDQRWIIPLCAIIGPIVFLASDILGRFLVRAEMPVGVVVAFVGAPVLILVVRGRKVTGL